jgi:hypothetical protein
MEGERAMSVLRSAAVLCLAALAAGCASPLYDSRAEYDAGTDFTAFRSYDWLPDPPAAEGDAELRAEIRAEADEWLSRHGLRRDAGAPDLLTAVHTGSRERATSKGIGRSERSITRYAGVPGSVPAHRYRYEEGSLAIDFLDPGSREALWHGSVKVELHADMDATRRANLVKDAVRKLLAQFPPAQAAGGR